MEDRIQDVVYDDSTEQYVQEETERMYDEMWVAIAEENHIKEVERRGSYEHLARLALTEIPLQGEDRDYTVKELRSRFRQIKAAGRRVMYCPVELIAVDRLWKVGLKRLLPKIQADIRKLASVNCPEILEVIDMENYERRVRIR